MERTPTYCFNAQRWKHAFLRAYFPDREFHFVPLHLSERRIARSWLPAIRKEPASDVFVWGWRVPRCVAAEAAARGRSICYVEDGFLRSAEPHSGRSAPFSLVLDRRRPYFDAGAASDLEDLLKSHDFRGDSELRKRAVAALRLFLDSGLSKYNARSSGRAESLYRQKRKRRVLVIGQVEDDASILLGCDRKWSNLDLVRAALAENPDAEIVYKPHPDVLNKVRLGSSGSERRITALCHVIDARVPLAQALETVDHVYTITSLAGFEALLRGIEVTTFGCPFYAGWGLTDDRQPNPRRERRLEAVDVFAGAYLLYARYFDPRSGRAISFEEALSLLQAQRGAREPPAPPPAARPRRPQWRAFGPYGLFGWRHLFTGVVAAAIARVGNDTDARHYREDPIGFFRELPDRRFRFVGRMLYPFGD